MIAEFERAAKLEFSAKAREIAEALVDGKCPDWPHYQLQVGILRGLAIAAELLAETRKKIEEEDNGEPE